MLTVIIIVNLIKGENIAIKGLISSVFCLQWYGYTVQNCGHLWYISCMLFCYLITPVLQWMFRQEGKKTLFRKCIFLALTILSLQVTYSLGGMSQATTSLLPYILGYFIASNKTAQKTRGGVQYFLWRQFGVLLYDVCE